MEMTSTRNRARAGGNGVGGAQRSGDASVGCIPGCEAIEPDGENAYRIALTATRRARGGEIHRPDAALRHRSAARLHDVASTGRAARRASRRARPRFRSRRPRAAPRPTLSYAVKAQVGGKIAQIGSRLVDGAAQKLADDFFGRFSDAVAAKAGVAPTRPPRPRADAALAAAADQS